MPQDLLSPLLARGGIRLSPGPLLSEAVAPKPADFDFARVEGMLLGLAMGDALGVPTESQLPRDRRARHGEIRDYVPNRYAGDGRGYPSDDTQLAFWTLEHLMEHGSLDPDGLAHAFAAGGRIFGIGQTVRAFLAAYKGGAAWYEAGPESAGNGALMRIAPVVVPHLKTGGTAVWHDVAIASMLTHNDYASTARCLAFARMLWDLLDMPEAPATDWWRERFVELAGPLEGASRYRPRGGDFTDYEGPLSRYVDERLRWAERAGVSTVDACNAWYSGAYLMETVPSVLLILSRHAGDPEEAIVRAVNDTRDNDTVAAIVGAAVGALHGRGKLPGRWVEGLAGWTRVGEEGRVFEMVEGVRGRFAPR
ncbi:MAG: ADP-ribosylglycohydrolase family protein [Gemmatimonadaceae bacterium]|nr:ADP-ribosylglycohydrolase family protein [Gemmatimonadaceae bacterium]